MSDMRESINAALDANAEDDDNQNYDETPQEIDYAAEETAETETGEEEGTSTDDDSTEPTEPTASDDTATGDLEGDKPAAVEAKPNGDSIKAPIDWGPQDREAWSKIPRHLQEKVMSREKELNTMLQTTADARKTHEQFGNLTQQYGAVLSGIGGDTPMETTKALFDTVANLRMGTPIQKAQTIADLINSFGVDINTLDSALVGQPPPQQSQQNSQIEQMLAERLAPFEAMMGQQNALQQQQEQQKQDAAISEVQQFAGDAEFLSDVRMDMADFIDMASARGQTMTIKEAYDKACAINPQIQAVLAQRAQRAKLTGSNNDMASKRLAGSSIVGNKGGSGGGGNSGSMRDMISAAWDGQNKI